MVHTSKRVIKLVMWPRATSTNRDTNELGSVRVPILGRDVTRKLVAVAQLGQLVSLVFLMLLNFVVSVAEKSV